MTIEPPEPKSTHPAPTEDHPGLVGGDWPSATSWFAITAVVVIAALTFVLHG